MTQRIAIVSHSHPSISKGGGEIAAYSLYRGLREEGFDAIFIGMCDQACRSQLHLQSKREHAAFFDRKRYDHFYHLPETSVTDQIVEIVENNDVSIVNLHHFYQIGISTVRHLARRPSISTVVTLHEFLAMCHHHGQMVTKTHMRLCERSSPSACAACFPDEGRRRFAMRRQLMFDGLESVNAIVSPSIFLAERFIDWGLPDDRVVVIENGLQIDADNPSRVRSAPTKERKWTFGYFGQINPYKGVDLIVKAATLVLQAPELCNRVHICIYGNIVGQSEEFVTWFKREVQENPILTWNGPYDNSEVTHLMSKCHYVIVPSRWWENSPVVIQEAFGSGCPVLCSGIGGMAEKVLDRESGLHFTCDSYTDLFRALSQAMDTALYGELVKGLPRPFTRREMARSYVSLFKEIQQKPIIDTPNLSSFNENKSQGI